MHSQLLITDFQCSIFQFDIDKSSNLPSLGHDVLISPGDLRYDCSALHVFGLISWRALCGSQWCSGVCVQEEGSDWLLGWGAVLLPGFVVVRYNARPQGVHAVQGFYITASGGQERTSIMPVTIDNPLVVVRWWWWWL